METQATAAPQIITVEEQLKRLRAGTKEVYEIAIRSFKIPVRILSIDEVNLIRRDAIKTAHLQAGDDVDKNVNIQRTTLAMASTITKNVPLLSDKLLGMMSVDEINHLYNEYIAVMENVNPSLETISEEVFRALVEGLKKNTVSSKDLSLHQLRAICTAYQDLIQRPAAQTSPVGS